MTAAMRLTGDCPKCGNDLVRKTRRSDGQPFLSCTGYPACKFAEDWDPHVAELAESVAELRTEVGYLRSELARSNRSSGSPSSKQTDLKRQLLELIAIAHPDRWPGEQRLAHEITTKLNALRGKLG